MPAANLSHPVSSDQAPTDRSGSDAPAAGSIRVRGLSKTFGPTHALWPLDLDIEPGSIVGLIGPNGSGKSTLMRCLVGLSRPDSGSIWMDAKPLKGDGVNIRRRLTYAPGEMGVYREMRGREHLKWYLRGRDGAALTRACDMASGLGLPLDRKLGTYSHGMKRQLIFAAAMAPKVPIRILDEITEGLDPSRRTKVTELLREDSMTGTTILLSSHHFGEVDRVCERILFMQAGKLLEDASAAAIHDRAARLVRIHWADEENSQAFEQALDPALYRNKRRLENELVLELTEADPRSLFQQITNFQTAPTQVQFANTTLQDLYRDLYGVEGT